MLVDPETGRPRKFAYAPGLVVVDGGPPQVAAAQRALDELGIDDIPVVRAGQAARGGLAARPGGPGDPAAAPARASTCCSGSATRRTASRSPTTAPGAPRSMVESLLDDVPGLGEVRRKTLLKHFGSLQEARGPPRSRRSPRCPASGRATAAAIKDAVRRRRKSAGRQTVSVNTATGEIEETLTRPSDAGRPSRGELVVVTGMTGAGRSTAAKELEDLGFFVVDNLPPQPAARRGPAGRREPRPEQPIAVVVDVRSGVVLRRPCRPTSPRAPPAGTRRWSSSRPTTTCWCAARRPPAARTRCRAAAGCSTGCSASAWCWPTCAATPTWSSTPRTLNVHQLTDRIADARSAPRRPDRLKVTRGQLRLQVRHPGRRRLRRRHAVPARTRTGSPSCAR